MGDLCHQLGGGIFVSKPVKHKTRYKMSIVFSSNGKNTISLDESSFNTEDYYFFLNKLANGDAVLFEKKYRKMFDFRDPKIKREEFNKIRNDIFKKLVSEYGKKCQLNIHKDCSKEKVFDVDHYIPLSTNELNKKLRKMKPQNGKKVPAQSFGSNDISNLRIACKRCNAFKKHKVI